MRAPPPGRVLLILGLALFCAVPAAAAVTGRTVNASGAPLAGIEIRFDDARTTTGADGHFIINPASPGLGRLSFHRDGQLLCGRENVEPDTALGPVIIDPTHRITGRVLGPDGTPLAAVSVRCAIELRDSWEEYRLVGATTTTDDGHFAFDACCPGNYRFHVAQPGALTGSHVLPVGGDFNHMVLRLHSGGSDVRGVITDPAGEPVADVAVAADCFHRCRSNADGHFRLVGLGPGWTQIAITPPEGLYVAGNQSTVQLSLEAGGETDHDIALVRAGALRVALTGPAADAQPARLDIRLRPQGHWDDTYTFLDREVDEGALRLDPIAAGSYDIAVRSSDSALLVGTVEISAGTTTAFNGALPPSTPIVGVVVDGRGQPVVGAQVWAYSLTRNRFFDSRGTLTDDRGRFELNGFGSDQLSLNIDHDDHMRLQRSIDRHQRAKAELRFEMHRQTRCSGTVRDAAGEVVAGARVSVHWQDGDVPSATTDAQGRFRIDEVPATQVRIRIHNDRFLPLERRIDLADTNGPLDLTLQPGERIGGVVQDADGQAVPGAGVQLRGADGATASCTADPAGRFLAGGLEPGTYALTAIHPQNDQMLVRRTGVAAGTRDLVLRPHPIETVRFEVHTHDRSPCPGATIRIHTLAEDAAEPIRLSLLSDATGAATADLPRGQCYMVRVSSAPAPVAVVPLDLRREPGADTGPLLVTLSDGQTLNCAVTGGAGCHLSVADPDDRLTRHHRGIPIADEPIVLRHLPRGLIRLQIHADAAGQHLLDERVVDTYKTDAIELAVPDCGRLRVALSAHSEVHAIALWDPRRRYTGHSDGEGVAIFARLPAGHYLVCGGPGAADAPTTAQVAPGTSTGISLRARPRERLSGALDPAGLAERSRLQLQHLPEALAPRQAALVGSVDRRQVRVTTNGAFGLAGPVPARYHATLLTGAYGREPLTIAHGTLRATAGGLELDLPPGQVRGTVVDAAGAPVAGAIVRAYHPDTPAHASVPSVRTAADGNFRFPHCDPADLRLSVQAGQAGWHCLRPEPDAAGDCGTLRLAPAHALNARLHAPWSSNATVLLYAADSPAVLAGRVLGGGMVRFPYPVAAGHYRLGVVVPDCAVSLRELELTGPAELDLAPPYTGSVDLRCHAPAGAVGHRPVRIHTADGRELTRLPALYPGPSELRQPITSASGRVLIRGLPQGAYRLDVGTHSTTVRVQPQRTVTADIASP